MSLKTHLLKGERSNRYTYSTPEYLEKCYVYSTACIFKRQGQPLSCPHPLDTLPWPYLVASAWVDIGKVFCKSRLVIFLKSKEVNNKQKSTIIVWKMHLGYHKACGQGAISLFHIRVAPKGHYFENLPYSVITLTLTLLFK